MIAHFVPARRRHPIVRCEVVRRRFGRRTVIRRICRRFGR
jgi:hypothetical protein